MICCKNPTIIDIPPYLLYIAGKLFNPLNLIKMKKLNVLTRIIFAVLATIMFNSYVLAEEPQKQTSERIICIAEQVEKENIPGTYAYSDFITQEFPVVFNGDSLFYKVSINFLSLKYTQIFISSEPDSYHSVQIMIDKFEEIESARGYYNDSVLDYYRYYSHTGEVQDYTDAESICFYQEATQAILDDLYYRACNPN